MEEIIFDRSSDNDLCLYVYRRCLLQRDILYTVDTKSVCIFPLVYFRNKIFSDTKGIFFGYLNCL